MWTTFSKQQTTQIQKQLVPGTYDTVTTITIPNTTGGIEIIPANATENIRFINLSVESKPDTNGDPISIYVGIGFVPTASLYSFEMLSGQQEYAMQINNQQINAICESGQTIKINVQIANAISKML